MKQEAAEQGQKKPLAELVAESMRTRTFRAVAVILLLGLPVAAMFVLAAIFPFWEQESVKNEIALKQAWNASSELAEETGSRVAFKQEPPAPWEKLTAGDLEKLGVKGADLGYGYVKSDGGYKVFIVMHKPVDEATTEFLFPDGLTGTPGDFEKYWSVQGEELARLFAENEGDPDGWESIYSGGEAAWAELCGRPAYLYFSDTGEGEAGFNAATFILEKEGNLFFVIVLSKKQAGGDGESALSAEDRRFILENLYFTGDD